MSVTGKPPPKASARGGSGASQYGAFVGSNPTVYTNLITHRDTMKKLLAVLLISVSPVSFAGLEQSPYERFDGTKKMSDTVTITWKTVPNVQEVCSKESLKRGKGKFGFAIDACAFWDKTSKGMTCTVVTKPTPNYWDLGHEMRHCFQGNWH